MLTAITSATVVLNNLSFDKIHATSTTLAQCWKSAYKGLVNDEYLSSLEDTHWSEFLEKSINDKMTNCIVAETSDNIIGVCIFGQSITEKYPDDGEIISLYVTSDFIGKGIGSMLFEKAQQLIKGQGYRACITCTFVKNYKAISFYKAHGYEIVSQDEAVKMGTQTLPYVIMRKVL